jgi:hypothetical protein
VVKVNPWRDITARVRRPKRKRRPLFECGACGRRYSNPLGHACKGGGGFRRKAAAEKRAQAAEKRRDEMAARRQRERDRVASVRKTERARADARVARAKARRRPPVRRTRPAHPYQSCREGDCLRVACVAFRDGIEVGFEMASEES